MPFDAGVRELVLYDNRMSRLGLTRITSVLAKNRICRVWSAMGKYPVAFPISLGWWSAHRFQIKAPRFLWLTATLRDSSETETALAWEGATLAGTFDSECDWPRNRQNGTESGPDRKCSQHSLDNHIGQDTWHDRRHFKLATSSQLMKTAFEHFEAVKPTNAAGLIDARTPGLYHC
ncbi:hypothetical protein BJ165DRAFT_1403923 [Panaeolus papilionaceus]|nr:hypothetical protein BJ165DRAFT_1403923 [Panaeolus papilionaceus]